MATKPRKRSSSDFYHVFQRGVNLFDIFEDDVDREFYIERLVRYAGEAGVEVHAWCFMSNHVHLLLRACVERLSALMMKLGSVYARQFNRRHRRTGPLFGCRFSSVPVETDTQMLAVVRYIHRNPVFHDECSRADSYRWSSYVEYANGEPATCRLDFVLALFGGVEGFARYHDGTCASELERHIDTGTIGPMRDDEARKRADAALRECGLTVDAAHIGTLPRRARNAAVSLVRRMVGCSLRQLQRLTGIAYATIRAATRGEGEDEFPDELASPFGSELAQSICAERGIGLTPPGRKLPPADAGPAPAA